MVAVVATISRLQFLPTRLPRIRQTIIGLHSHRFASSHHATTARRAALCQSNMRIQKSPQSTLHNSPRHVSVSERLFQRDNSVPSRYLSTSSSEANFDESSVPRKRSVRILYGSQGGTAQLFAIQLSDELAEIDPDIEVTVSALNEHSPVDILSSSSTISNDSDHEEDEGEEDIIHVFLLSVTGNGEPPDNAREFYSWLMDNATKAGEGEPVDWTKIKFAVFGLGNSKAHPHQYNVIGKSVDAKLEELGAARVHDLGLGDDGECIEDDFDVWMDSFLRTLEGGDDEEEGEAIQRDDSADSEGSTGRDTLEDGTKLQEIESTTEDKEASNIIMGKCAGAKSKSGLRRMAPQKYPTLSLRPPASEYDGWPRDDLFHLQTSDRPFYQPDTYKLPMLSNRPLGMGSGEHTLHEMRLSLEAYPNMKYEVGDHMVLYPRNAQSIVEAYLEILDVHPRATIEGVLSSSGDEHPHALRSYPHPTDITVEETLSHVVDLGSPPSPAFARNLLGRTDIYFKEDVALPRRTVLDLIRDSGVVPSLEELLFNLPPMHARYYSIASSPSVHPREIYIVYRPVVYVTKRGTVREGVCTSYMKLLQPVSKDDEEETDVTYPRVVAGIRSNPSFRLPQDPATPVLLIAGGCGIAPIRAFIEERMFHISAGGEYGDAAVYLGFRSPKDEVYRSLIERALECGAITEAHISYTYGCLTPEQNCRFVSDTIIAKGAEVYDLIRSGGRIYLCGGAQSFGVALENATIQVFMEHGAMGAEDAEENLRSLIKGGCFVEDLAD